MNGERMKTRDRVLELLQAGRGRYVSGEEMASELGMSRESVRLAVRELQEAGWFVDAVRNRGYRLGEGNDVVTEEGIRACLRHRELGLRVRDRVTSTNTVLKEEASQGAPEGTVLIALSQTQGRGRLGRSFYSPPATGIYLSILFRPQMSALQAMNLTSCAAVAVAETIEELSGRAAQIKWVNDVYVGGRKVCGILTEAALDLERGIPEYCVVGIGVNTGKPAGDFPEEIRDIAGAAFPDRIPDLRNRLAAGILDRMWDYYPHLEEKPFYEAYRDRSMLIGQPVNILRPGQDPVPAEAVDVDRDFALVVRTEDGSLRRIQSGEVSVRIRKD